MTREEAIWYLQPIADSASLERYKEALGMAIAALREQEERSKGCMYCDIAKANAGVINKALWMKESETHKWTLCGKRLEFCPMCGRRLEEV